MQVDLMKVVSNDLIADNIYKLIIKGDIVEKMDIPGQFVNVKVGSGQEFPLRRPISICEINKEKNEFVLIYRALGDGTKELSKLKENDDIDILGPLGTGYDISTISKNEIALLVGGGIGVPPLYELAKQFVNNGIEVVSVLGFNNKKDVFYVDEFKKFGKTYISTVDGSFGEKGYVTDIILNNNIKYDKYYACGPNNMLRALKYLDENKKGFISLEERMACGIGACFACVCKTKDEQVTRICKEGPVYSSDLINFDKE